ncbi:unnamed protein product [Echinostoma caproni]|uniref:WD_REPEATS_REGION domain-containing protein n=1 Tax=Echinostoma caproni TaxID=27848 RepID=A0A183AX23_9TREM|nr:unnamed protein product [Echinostoma caproni]
MRVMERMICQNCLDDILIDFHSWNDPADEVREQGSLYPLWRFKHPGSRQKRLPVTSIRWSTRYADLFYVGYGEGKTDGRKCNGGAGNDGVDPNSFDNQRIFYKTDEYLDTETHDLWQFTPPTYSFKSGEKVSRLFNQPHFGPCWNVEWLIRSDSNEMDVVSIAGDGRLLCWSVQKVLFGFPTSSGLYEKIAMGTGSGRIVVCSTIDSGQIDYHWPKSHDSPVQQVRWNPIVPDILISCSFDRTVKFWTPGTPYALTTIELFVPVSDVCWAPYSSTTFALVTQTGQVQVFDLFWSQTHPLATHELMRGRIPVAGTKLIFNTRLPLLLVGDEQ